MPPEHHRDEEPSPTTAGVADTTAATPNAADAAPTVASEHSSQIRTPTDALAHDDRLRTSQMVPVVLGLGAMSLAALPFLGGDSTLKSVEAIALVCGMIGTAVIGHLAKSTSRYRRPWRIAAWIPALALTWVNTAYFGLYSPAPIIIALAVYSFARGEARSISIAATVSSCVFCGTLFVLYITETATDPAIMSASVLDARHQFTGHGLVQAIIAGAGVIGMRARRASLESYNELYRALRSVEQRDAMVAEVRKDLQRAMGAGEPGRLTGHLANGYILAEVVGRGRLGEVYAAHSTSGGDTVAIKVLLPVFAQDSGAIERFMRDAKLAATLETPHVVKFIASGTIAESPYLAMEYLRGHDLGHYLRSHGRLSPATVIELTQQVGRGLTAAASQGIVHRDIKPRNLFLAETPTGAVWKIIDFGVSKFTSGIGTLTHGQWIGTSAYMAPEQAQGKDATVRADVYSLAAIAYRGLTGFTVLDNTEIQAMPRRPSRLHDLPDAVDSVLAVGLAKSPTERFAVATKFANALKAAVNGVVDSSIDDRAYRILSKTPWRE